MWRSSVGELSLPEVIDVNVPASVPRCRGVPMQEVLADYQTALVSRFLDDREIALQKQSRGFFHISSAGHEALCLGFARSLRPARDWFFPYYRDRPLVLALGVSPTELLLQAVGAANDPASGGPPNAVAFRGSPPQHRHPVEPDRFPMPASGRLCRSRPLHLGSRWGQLARLPG